VGLAFNTVFKVQRFNNNALGLRLEVGGKNLRHGYLVSHCRFCIRFLLPPASSEAILKPNALLKPEP
jgi:hypothetical protein